MMMIFARRKRSLTFLIASLGASLCLPPSGAFASSAVAAAPASRTSAIEALAPEQPLISGVSTSLQYAQSPGFWSTVQSVQSTQGNLSRIEETLRDKFGTFEEAFSRFRVRMGLGSYYLGLQAETIVSATVRSPVLPELKANLIGTGSLNFGAAFKSLPFGLKGKAGITAGMGFGRGTHLVTTDLIEKARISNERLLTFGAEGRLTRAYELSDHWRASAQGEYELNRFLPDQSSPVTTLRWKLLGATDFNILRDQHVNPAIGLHGILGPQPLPVDILPAVWDYIHHQPYLPELRALIGIGAQVKLELGSRRSLILQSGQYGGFWGVGLTGSLGGLGLSAGSWKYSASQDYLGLSQRVWTAGAGFRF